MGLKIPTLKYASYLYHMEQTLKSRFGTRCLQYDFENTLQGPMYSFKPDAFHHLE